MAETCAWAWASDGLWRVRWESWEGIGADVDDAVDDLITDYASEFIIGLEEGDILVFDNLIELPALVEFGPKAFKIAIFEFALPRVAYGDEATLLEAMSLPAMGDA